MMTDQELALEGARAIINTGVEGGYGSVSCSTAGDYPSIGVSQWEGLDGRGDALLSAIEGGEKFVGRSYSDIRDCGDLDELSEVLNSPAGQEVQQQILASDILEMYIPVLQEIENLDDSRCFLYAIVWCPTSHIVVRNFLRRRQDSNDIRNLEVVRDLFRDQYYIAADVGEEYAAGYANRADNTFDYVSSLDLSAYGVPAYGA